MTTIREARVIVGKRLGFAADFDGTPQQISNLAAVDRDRLLVATVNYITSNPEEFADQEVETARAIASRSNFGKIGDYAGNDLLDQASEFVVAFGDVARDTAVGTAKAAGDTLAAAGLSPFKLIAVAGGLVGLWLGLPKVIAQIRGTPKP